MTLPEGEKSYVREVRELIISKILSLKEYEAASLPREVQKKPENLSWVNV